MCESCLEERLEEERLSLLVYSRAAIYVRQLEKIGVNDILLDLPSGSAPIEDPDFQVVNNFYESDYYTAIVLSVTTAS